MKSEGIEVVPYIHGIGENQAVRDVFVKRANDAWEAPKIILVLTNVVYLWKTKK